MIKHNKIGICGSLDVQKYGSKFGCCVCVGYCKKFPASAQALSKHLRTCENKGYIERVNDKVNRRNVMINLTDKGEKVFEITTQEFVLLKNKVFEKIDIDEFREAIKKMFEFREVLSATIDELSKKTGGGENN